MISSMRRLVLTLLVACAVTAASPRAAAPDTPGQAGQTTPAATAAAKAGPPLPVKIERLIDRVWVVDASTAVAPGSLYVFLADNVLVVSPKGGTPTIGTWAEDVEGLVITEKGRTSKVDVLDLTAERLQIRIKSAKAANEITLSPAIRPEPAPAPPQPTAATAAAPAPAPTRVVAPIGAPYRCGGDTFRVAFDGDKAYLTWPDNTVVVLTEMRVADAPASRRTYSDGQIRVVEDTSEAFARVLFARPGFRPRPCSSTR
jgi:hypothetical protein